MLNLTYTDGVWGRCCASGSTSGALGTRGGRLRAMGDGPALPMAIEDAALYNGALNLERLDTGVLLDIYPGPDCGGLRKRPGRFMYLTR